MNQAFDKLAFLRRLEEAKFTREQSEALTEAVHDAVTGAVATKMDIDALAASTHARFGALDASVNARFDALTASTQAQFNTASASTRARFGALDASVNARFDATLVALERSHQATMAAIDRTVLSIKLWAVVGAAGTVVTTITVLKALSVIK